MDGTVDWLRYLYDRGIPIVLWILLSGQGINVWESFTICVERNSWKHNRSLRQLFLEWATQPNEKNVGRNSTKRNNLLFGISVFDADPCLQWRELPRADGSDFAVADDLPVFEYHLVLSELCAICERDRPWLPATTAKWSHGRRVAKRREEADQWKLYDKVLLTQR